MDNTVKNKVNQTIYRRYPEVKDIKPAIKKINGKDRDTYLFVYKRKIKSSPDNEVLKIIRVTTDQNGKILKVSVSK